MTDDRTLSDRMVEAEQARDAFDRFMGPALATARADYLTKLADVAARPMSDPIRAGMEKLATGIKVVDEVEAQLRGLMMDGALAQRDARRASRLANLTTEERKWLSFAPAPL